MNKKAIVTALAISLTTLNGSDLNNEEEIKLIETYEGYLKTEKELLEKKLKKCEEKGKKECVQEVSEMLSYIKHNLNRFEIDDYKKKENVAIAKKMLEQHLKRLKGAGD